VNRERVVNGRKPQHDYRGQQYPAVRRGIGRIDAKGLKKVDGSYVNEAYGESDTNLSVEVKGGVGEINLKVV
jgi:hypothetical protein